jgi:hypothetical protein
MHRLAKFISQTARFFRVSGSNAFVMKSGMNSVSASFSRRQTC